jgi:hypothetical protein
MNGIHKLIDILKSLVHRRVTQIRYFINLAQFFEHFGSNSRGRNFPPAGFKFMHNFVYHLLQRKKTGRAFFKGFRDTGSEFASVKWLMGSVPFYHPQV